MKLVAFVAMGENRVIGCKGKLPWHISTDLQRFKKLTLGHPVIMGRRTFDSIGRPLPGRRNIVLTRNTAWSAAGVEVFTDADAVLADLRRSSEAKAFIIGGGELYRLFLPVTDTIYLTQVDASPDGDAFFPDIASDANFALVSESQTFVNEPDGLTFRFLEYARKN